MHTYTRSIGAAFGVLMVSGAAGGVPGVRYIDAPDGDGYLYATHVSGDGSTIVGSDTGETPSIPIDRGHGWEEIIGFQSNSDTGFTSGLSYDGSTVVFNNLYGNQAGYWQNGSVQFIGRPRYEREYAHTLYMYGVSGDGRVMGARAGFASSPTSVYLYSDGDFVSLDEDRSTLGFSQSISALSFDGSRVAVSDTVETEINGRIQHQKRAWLWEGGELTQITDEMIGDEIYSSRTIDMSSDGAMVLGSSTSFIEDDDSPFPYGDSQAWIAQDGGVTLIDNAGFESVNGVAISGDGSSVLTHNLSSVDEYGYYLWNESAGFVSLIDLFAQAGVEGDFSNYHFVGMSDDATVFVGFENPADGVFRRSVVVTIPSPGGVLALLGGLLMVPARRRARG